MSSVARGAASVARMALAGVFLMVAPTAVWAGKDAAVTVVSLPGLTARDAQISADKGDMFYLVDPDGSKRQMRLRAGKVVATGQAPVAPLPRPPGALPDAVVAAGSNQIARAWLAQPTGRYGHGIIGDKLEAGTMVVKGADGRTARLVLDRNSVFEDIAPRLGDVDGDGLDEVVSMRTYLDAGAALFVAQYRGGKLSKLAEGPNFGQPARWLDPAGIADFTGDGRNEIAIVITPHIGGSLQLWSLRGGKLLKLVEAPDFSNHAIGSRVLDNSAIADFDGDGIVDIAVPSADRQTLRLISLRGGGLRQITSIAVPDQITKGVVALATPRGLVILAGLRNGDLAVIRLPAKG